MDILFTESKGHSSYLETVYENEKRIEVAINAMLDNSRYTLLFIPQLPIELNNILELINRAGFNKCLTRLKSPGRNDKVICVDCGSKSIDHNTCYICNSKNIEWFTSQDTYVTSKSYNDVLNCIIILMSSIINIINGKMYQYLLIRPPGHHCFNKAKGFCLINNVFLLSEYAIMNGFKRVMILDYDYHHADGTSELIKGKENRYLISIHAFGKGIYPGTGHSSENKSNVKNIPLFLNEFRNETYYTDEICIEIFNTRVKQYFTSFNPDIILISNGLDAHKDDPVGGLNLTELFYVYVANYLKSLNVPLIYVLEGGYNPNVIRDVSMAIIDQFI